MKSKLLPYAPVIFIAFVFIQSLFFKFSGSYETQYIFGILSTWSGFHWFRDYGAYLVGSAELVASILLFTRLRFYGALMTVCVMSGAIYFHLFTPLGIHMPEFNAAGEIVGNDGGTLFILACAVWFTGSFIVIRNIMAKRQTPCQALNEDGEPLC
ncbi:hypothetical protein [Marinomonas pollencensis]|uniref:Membrane protein YkgB n=1 Tax=Marinomonas pollencensis TaxID=491954 RepID=A0A3E0D9U3_9GAMM|nr:hypothetical protein [Marinomonas pollencensis]REG79430.1 hypothetical protein DFP81_11922 [Marinomonas pollencensis]